MTSYRRIEIWGRWNKGQTERVHMRIAHLIIEISNSKCKKRTLKITNSFEVEMLTGDQMREDDRLSSNNVHVWFTNVNNRPTQSRKDKDRWRPSY